MGDHIMELPGDPDPAARGSIGLLQGPDPGRDRSLFRCQRDAAPAGCAYAIALGIGGPLLGRLVDRRGPTSVLLGSASIACALLVAIGVLPAHAPFAGLAALAAGIGLATPPVGACLRAQLPALLTDRRAIRSAFALEASLVELTYIFGPPLALCVGALWSSGTALAVAGIALLAATAAFAAQPASRMPRPVPVDRPSRGGSLRTPAMRTLAIVLLAVGVLLGADEVAVIAAAKALHSTIGGAPLFAVWGAGSFIGGLLVARLGGGARTAGGLALLLGALTAGHLGLIPAGGNVLALGGGALRRRRRDRADGGHRLCDGRQRRTGGHRHRGIRLARHGHGGRRCGGRCRRWTGRRPHRPGSGIRLRRRSRCPRVAHGHAAVAHDRSADVVCRKSSARALGGKTGRPAARCAPRCTKLPAPNSPAMPVS